MMSTESPVAFKEWACVVEALGSGKQSVILRKGGIHEAGKKWNSLRDSFLLFPTCEHQNPVDLKPEGQKILDQIPQSGRKVSRIVFRYLAEIQDEFFCRNFEKLKSIDPYHVWSEQAVLKKFSYGEESGLHVLLVRVSKLASPLFFKNLPEYGGCRSWVELKEPQALGQSHPVVAEEDFLHLQKKIRALLV